MKLNKGLFTHEKKDWGTPNKLFQDLNEVYHFNLDPCSSETNHKCELYYTKEMNGLEKNWGGKNVFMNPPYGSEIKCWVKKAYEESLKPNTTIVMLLPARTDTIWFHSYVYGKAHLHFIKGRIKFLNNGVEEDSAPFPSMIAVLNGKPYKEGLKNDNHR